MAGGVEDFLAGLGAAAPAARATLGRLADEGFVGRLWSRDPTLWKADAPHQQVIGNRLGWLDIVRTMRDQVGRLTALAGEARATGLTHALLLGMGGSSLCPEVLRLTFGVPTGGLDLRVLDSTDPAAVAAVARALPLDRTLVLVSTKSGTTLETLSLYAHFRARLDEAVGAEAGRRFVAVTDPGTPLERLAWDGGFRRVLSGTPDIGGRYSALSVFGLLPGALMNLDLAGFLDRADAMVRECGAEVPPAENPGVRLGVALGELARAGRDKVTFLLSPGIAAFGTWVEQLLAESTGKEGRGLVPVADEAPGPAAVYGADRVFVVMSLEAEAEPLARAVAPLAAAGHPVLRLGLRDRLDLGAEFFRWELATAVAGALLGVNAFDEPNVQESKDNTSRLLGEYEQHGRLPDEIPTWRGDGLTAYAGTSGVAPASLSAVLAAQLVRARRGAYVALMAYLPPTDAHTAGLQVVRHRLRDMLRVATTVGYGPRFLHSTGQLHKGGPPTGAFLQVTADDPVDQPIPGKPFGFGVLKQAQALGDLGALRARGRPVVRVHVSGDLTAGLTRLRRAVEEARLPPAG